MWRKLLDDLVTSLPFLQMYLDKRSKLGTCLLGLLAPPGKSPHSLTADGEIVPFSQFERLRGWLRCMFLKEKTLRAKCYGYLIHRLVEQDVKSKCEMVYPSGALENSCELFIIETFAASVRLHRSSKHANFDEDRMRKLLDILATETNELSLRKSSAEQLAVLMQGKQDFLLIRFFVKISFLQSCTKCPIMEHSYSTYASYRPALSTFPVGGSPGTWRKPKTFCTTLFT